MSHRAAAHAALSHGAARRGETVPLRTLLEGVAIASANDAATAVAEHLGGTEEAFVAAHERQGRRSSGSPHTHFANAHGLPDPAQRSTAEDLARLTQRLLDDYPSSRPLLGGADLRLPRARLQPAHPALPAIRAACRRSRPASRNEAGYNLAISAWRRGQQFLLIVLGAQTRSLSFRDAQACSATASSRPGCEVAPPAAGPATRKPSPRRPRASERAPAARGAARRAAAMAPTARLRLRRLRHALRRPLRRRGGRGPSPPTRRPSRCSGARSSSSTRGCARSWSATRTSGW